VNFKLSPLPQHILQSDKQPPAQIGTFAHILFIIYHVYTYCTCSVLNFLTWNCLK